MSKLKVYISVIVPVVMIAVGIGAYFAGQSESKASVSDPVVSRADLHWPAKDNGRIYDSAISQLSEYLPADLSDEEFRCLAQAVYFEARSEPFEGQVAVAYVVLNRVADKRYPNSICKVVFQNEHWRNRCQFSFACDGLTDKPFERAAWVQARLVAGGAVSNRNSDVTSSSTHYHAKYVNPTWAQHLRPTLQIGKHIFYREES